jgi:hypothetical protein
MRALWNAVYGAAFSRLALDRLTNGDIPTGLSTVEFDAVAADFADSACEARWQQNPDRSLYSAWPLCSYCSTSALRPHEFCAHQWCRSNLRIEPDYATAFESVAPLEPVYNVEPNHVLLNQVRQNRDLLQQMRQVQAAADEPHASLPVEHPPPGPGWVDASIVFPDSPYSSNDHTLCVILNIRTDNHSENFIVPTSPELFRVMAIAADRLSPQIVEMLKAFDPASDTRPSSWERLDRDD